MRRSALLSCGGVEGSQSSFKAKVPNLCADLGKTKRRSSTDVDPTRRST